MKVLVVICITKSRITELSRLEKILETFVHCPIAGTESSNEEPNFKVTLQFLMQGGFPFSMQWGQE